MIFGNRISPRTYGTRFLFYAPLTGTKVPAYYCLVPYGDGFMVYLSASRGDKNTQGRRGFPVVGAVVKVRMCRLRTPVAKALYSAPRRVGALNAPTKTQRDRFFTGPAVCFLRKDFRLLLQRRSIIFGDAHAVEGAIDED
jgi:hypothetical protein